MRICGVQPLNMQGPAINTWLIMSITKKCKNNIKFTHFLFLEKKLNTKQTIVKMTPSVARIPKMTVMYIYKVDLISRITPSVGIPPACRVCE